MDFGPVSPPCPPPDIDIEAWQDSIRRIRQLRPEAIYLTHYGAIAGERNINAHFDSLAYMLEDWSEWILAAMQAGRNREQITPAFHSYALEQLKSAGLDQSAMERYEAANPAWMSVAGLMRYWKLKMEN